MTNVDIDKPEMFFRAAHTEDGARMWSFVKEHGVLELNSAYCYLLMAAHFGRTCLIAETAATADTEAGKRFAGFVLAFRPPQQTEDLFVWQIGVHPALRGRGVGMRMLRQILGLPGCRGVRYVSASVAHDNEPSRALFRGFARDVGAHCEESEFFGAELFPPGGGQHAAEDLFRIGPLDSAGATDNV